MYNSTTTISSSSSSSSRVCTTLLVANLTMPGNDVLSPTDWPMVAATVVVTVLAAVLVVLCMLDRLSRSHRGYSIATRVLLHAAFTLFLPFMSYIFSQTTSKPDGADQRLAELVILWMLLVELLRKKVSTGMAPANEAFARGIGGYSLLYPVEEVVRMAWIGYLVYAYVHGHGIKPLFVILWTFGVMTLCKRIVFIQLANHSFDLAKNAGLISNYMTQLVLARRQLLHDYEDYDHQHHGHHGVNVMKMCNYVVMGESRLTRVETPQGLEINDQEVKDILRNTSPDGDQEAKTSMLVRVCDIWKLAEDDPLFRYNKSRRRKLEDICLALALFKLLRRKVEGYHMAEAKTLQARMVVFRGLLNLDGGGEEADAERAFEVVELELRFLNEYYQDIIPWSMVNLKYFLVSFALSIIFLFLYCITVLLVTSDANIITALGSMLKGLAGLFISMVAHHKCFLHQVASFIIIVRTTFDIIITYLLMLTLLIVQTYQSVHYVLSDWFLVSLLCNYTRKPSQQKLRRIHIFVKSILRVKHSSRPVIKVHQLNMLNLHRLRHLCPRVWMLISHLLSSVLNRRIVGLPDATVTLDAKMAIVQALKDVLASPNCSSCGGAHFTNGVVALRRHGFPDDDDVDTDSGITTILVWHIATTLFEMRDRPMPPQGEAAVTFSRYCAYLVAYEPGLLSENKEWAEKEYKYMSEELKIFFQSCCISSKNRRQRLMRLHLTGDEEKSPMAKGIKLGRLLDSMATSRGGDRHEDDRVWRMLQEFWAELLVSVARRPSKGAEAHAMALANGGEFITHIWAMLTHASISVPEHHNQVPPCHPL